MKMQLKHILQSGFAKNVGVVATGTAIAQLLNLGFAPVITRIYGPEAFGLLGTFNALLAVIAPLAAFSYPLAIVIPKQDDNAIALAKLSITLAALTSTIIALIVVIFGEQIVLALANDQFRLLLYFLPPAMILMASFNIVKQWAVRKGVYGLISRAVTLRSLVDGISKTAAGLLLPSSVVLIVLTIVSTAVQTLILWLGVGRAIRQGSQTECSKELKKVARDHREFPIYRAPQVFINSLSVALPVVLLTAFFGAAVAGLYTLSRTVLTMPATLVGTAVVDVFYPRSARAVHEGENVRPLILKATLALMVVGLAPFGFVLIFGGDIFSIVFGDEWYRAGQYATWLSVWSYFGFINRPSVASIPVLGLQRFFLGYEVVSLIVRVGSLVLGFIVYENDLVAVALFAVTSAVLNLYLVTYTLAFAAKGKKRKRVHE